MASYEDSIRAWLADQAQMRATGGAPSTGPAASAAPVAPTGAEKFGARVARVLKSPWLKRMPGLGALAEGMQGDATVPNAIRTGVGAGALVNPAVGGPLAAGMLAGEGIASGLDLAFQPGKSNILNPAFSKEIEARGGMAKYLKRPTREEIDSAIIPNSELRDVAFSPADQKPGFIGGYQESVARRGFGANNQPYQPVTRTVNPDGTISITGSGTPRFSSGAFTGFGAGGGSAAGSNFQPQALPSIDSATGLPGTSPEDRAKVGNIAGNFMGSLIGMKQIAGDNALRVTAAKQMIEGIKVGSHLKLESAQAQEALAKGDIKGTHAVLARMILLETNPAKRAQLAEAAASLEGRIGPSDRWNVPQNFMEPIKAGGAVPMASTSGAIEMRRVKPLSPTKEDIAATAKANNMTEAQVIARLKAEGRM